MQRVGTDRAGEGFLTAEQQRRYGRYAGEPDQAQLDRYFHLDTAARELVDVRRGQHNRLGFAVQLGTVRFLGTFLPDPVDVPWSVAAHLAAQLGIADPGALKQYAVRDGTNRLHAGEIQQAYGYRDFTDPAVQQDLLGWLEARTALASERPGCCSTWPPHDCSRQRCYCPARPCWPASSPRSATRRRPGCGSPWPWHPTPPPGGPGSRVCSSSATGNVAQPWTGYAAGPAYCAPSSQPSHSIQCARFASYRHSPAWSRRPLAHGHRAGAGRLRDATQT